MKRILLATLIIVAFFSGVTASPVSPEEASAIAASFLKQSSVKEVPFEWEHLYVFNGDHSFVILSADDRVFPVLGYSYESCFRPESMPVNTKSWLQSYDQETLSLIEAGVKADNEVKEAWDALRSGMGLPVVNRSVVGPLIITKWNQRAPYNGYCPSESLTGCVATSMAQIMKYWEYPNTGVGFHSYYHSTYGSLSANFGATVYDWDNMPSVALTSSPELVKQAVATLLYQCGVSVDMNYGPSFSGAPSNNVPLALSSYFRYAPTLSLVFQYDYTDEAWKALLKTEMDEGRPCYYAGQTSKDGHAFIVDGYDEMDYFHINWGWGGQSNGYYRIGALNPGTQGPYNVLNHAVIGICPNELVMDAPANLVATVTDGQVSLTWDAVESADTYNVYRDGELLARALEGTSYIDQEVGYTTYTYYVKAITSVGDRSPRSRSVTVTVEPQTLSPNNLKATFQQDKLMLNWEMPYGANPNLHYGNFTGTSAYGYNGAHDTYWGQRYSVLFLKDYAGMSMKSVSLYCPAGTYTLYLCKGDLSNEWELLAQKEVAFDGVALHEIMLDEPIAIDYTQDLWVVFSAPSTIAYPACFSPYDGPWSADAGYIGTTFGSFLQMNEISWMMRVNLLEADYTYNLSKNGTLIATSLTEKSYEDTDLSSGEFNYQVWASLNGVTSAEPASCTVSLARLSVSSSNSDAGTITGGGLALWGSRMTVVASPNEGYVFRGWVRDGEYVSTNLRYSLTLEGDVSLLAVFAGNYAITATAEPTSGGKVSGMGVFPDGETCTLVATPNEGYDFIAWMENDVKVATSEQYAFVVNSSRDLVAVFARKYFTITASADLGGNISPSGAVTVNRGASQTFTMTPEHNCRISSVVVDGVDMGVITTYTFNDVNEDHVIQAHFQGWGVDEDAAAVEVYPNPAHDRLYIKSDFAIRKMELIDINGTVIESRLWNNNTIDLELTSFAKGVYLLKLDTERGVVVRRVVVSE